jgi:hypothetical protein
MASQPPLSLGAYGEWTWLRHLPTDDLDLFLDEVRQALIVAAHTDGCMAESWWLNASC